MSHFSPDVLVSPLETGSDAEELRFLIQRLTEIGRALSSERDLSSLLERILAEARRFTSADAGTIYMLRDDGALHFEVMHNDTFGTYLGGSSGNPIPSSLNPVALDKAHVSGYSALSGETVNIPDVYAAEGFDFSGTRAYDQRSGYRSKSMLVVPMKNHESTVVGVLQLINAKSPRNQQFIPFSDRIVDLVESLASQAAVALTNTQLIQESRALFEALIRVMAKAVDKKDPTTAGHTERVTQLSVALAETVNETTEGELAGVRFSEQDLEELRIAGWLHDIGKLTTPEPIINKGKKLEAFFDRVAVLKERFQAIKAIRRSQGWEEQARLLRSGAPKREIREAECRCRHDMDLLEEELGFLISCNEPVEDLADPRFERLKSISEKTYVDLEGRPHPYLTEDEMENLSIRKGSFTPNDLQIMREHVSVTMELLNLVPFTKRLAHVPLYAGQHHELLDGSGYPNRLSGQELPLLSRILTLCDIFDALSAKDRPYKKAYSLETCLNILAKEMAGKLDSRLVELFIRNRLWERVGLHRESEEPPTDAWSENA
jgi:HD-GYP domain-containing protein (c-di-GMP phosphodiesterase class II)